MHLFLTSILTLLPISYMFALFLATLHHPYFSHKMITSTFWLMGIPVTVHCLASISTSTLYHTFLSLIAFHTFWLAQKKGLYGKTVQKWNLFFWWQHSETHSSSKYRLSLAAWGVPHGLIHLNEGNASMYHSSCSPKGTGLLSVESRVWEVVSAHKFLTGHVHSIGYLKH